MNYSYGLLGQSNANNYLRNAIIQATGEQCINSYHGGQFIESWYVFPTYFLFDDIAALGIDQNCTYDTIIWFQGESNALVPESWQNYETLLIALLDWFISEHTQVIIIGTWDNAHPYLAQCMNNLQHQIAIDWGYTFIDSKGLDRVDSVHLSERGIADLAQLIRQATTCYPHRN